MPVLAETLVEEWLNQQSFLMVRSVLDGFDEMGVLAVRLRLSERSKPEAWHVEVQSSFRPMNYLTPLTRRIRTEIGTGAGTAVVRTPAMVRECVEEWIKKKYENPREVQYRNYFYPRAVWKRVLVHAVVKHEEELEEFRRQGIELVPIESVLEMLCSPIRPAFSASAGTDIEDLNQYYGRVEQLPVDAEIKGEDE